MIALDTNVLIRLAVNDHQQQSEVAERLVRDNRVFISKSVLLESERVLRHSYRCNRERIAWFFRQIFEPWNSIIENPEQVAVAIEWYEAGCDFADALHLARSHHASSFATFDRRLAKRATALGMLPTVDLLE